MIIKYNLLGFIGERGKTIKSIDYEFGYDFNRIDEILTNNYAVQIDELAYQKLPQWMKEKWMERIEGYYE